MGSDAPPERFDRTMDVIGLVLDDRYRVEAVLRKSAVGTVYRAQDPRMKRPVVVTVSHRRFLAEEGTVVMTDEDFHHVGRRLPATPRPDGGLARMPAGDSAVMVTRICTNGEVAAATKAQGL